MPVSDHVLFLQAFTALQETPVQIISCPACPSRQMSIAQPKSENPALSYCPLKPLQYYLKVYRAYH